MNSVSENLGRNYHFVTYTGAPTTDPGARKLAKQDVMQHIRRSRKNPLAPRRHVPLQCDLDVPQTFVEKRFYTPKLLNPGSSQADAASDSELSDPQALNTSRSFSVVFDTSTRTLIQGTSIISRLGAGRGDPFIQFPIEMNSRSRELVDLIFDESTGKSSPLKVAWFQISMLDAAAFHQLLSGAATYFNNLRNGDGGQANGESLAHHAYSLQLVNSQIREVGTTTTDGIISSIVGFACYYHLIGDMYSWKKHLAGLKEIVHLRGGIETLESNQFLRTMLSCIDISGSCTLDEEPYFPFPTRLIPLAPPFLRPRITGTSCQNHIDSLYFNFVDSYTLIDVLVDLSAESLHLQHEVQRTEGRILVDSMHVCNFINPILHRLLSLPRQDSSFSIATMDEMIRLAAILYLIAIRQSFGIYPTRVTSQIRRLSALLMNFEGCGTSDGMLEDHRLGWMELWVLSVGCIMSDENVKSSWFGKRLQCAMRRMSLTTYGDLEDELRAFSWVDEIHGTLLKKFRNKLVSG